MKVLYAETRGVRSIAEQHTIGALRVGLDRMNGVAKDGAATTSGTRKG